MCEDVEVVSASHLDGIRITDLAIQTFIVIELVEGLGVGGNVKSVRFVLALRVGGR